MDDRLEKLCLKILNELKEADIRNNGKNKIFTDLFERYKQIDEVDADTQTFQNQVQNELMRPDKPATAEDFERTIQDIINDLQDEKPIKKSTSKYVDFNCPICGCTISEDGVKCLDCSLEIVDMNDFPDKEILRKNLEVSNISTLSLAEKSLEEMVKELDGCTFESNKESIEGAIDFVCPKCSILVHGEITSCPGCGAKFGK